MAYFLEGPAEVCSMETITSRHLVRSATEDDAKTYVIEVPPKMILRPKVNHGETPEAEVRVRAWRDDKLLGSWPVGRIKDLGLEGFKSEPIHLLRVEQWKKTTRGAAP